MADFDHHAAAAMRQNAEMSAGQNGGGQAGTHADQEHGTKMFGSSAASMESQGFAHANVTGKHGDLNNNLMDALNAGGEKFGGKINVLEGMQHAEMNPASGKNMTAPVLQNVKLVGKAQEQGGMAMG